MKVSALLFALALLIHSAPAEDRSFNNRVSVSARADIDTDLRNIKGSTDHVHNQKTSLEISLTGRPQGSETRTLKWFIFGRDVRSNKVTIIESGEGRLALDEVGRQALTTRVVSSTYTPDHSVVERTTTRNKKTGKKEQHTRVRRVNGSGAKYTGYGVLVKEGDTVVGKVFMSPGLEAEVR